MTAYEQQLDRQLNRQDDSFKLFVLVSLVIHLSVIFAISIKNAFFMSNETIVIPQSMRVDIVALPDKATEEPAPKPAKVAPTPPKPTPPKPAPKVEPKENVKDLQKRALEKLKAQTAIDKIKNEVDEEKAKAAKDEPAKPKQVKGNIVSSGSSFSGMSQLRVNEYLEDLTARLRDHWSLPQWLSEANLKASVVIDIDDRGNLVRREIYASSGNQVFDSACLAAVADASPFAPPPNELKSRLIMVRFPFE